MKFKCPVCSGKHTLREIYELWDDDLDNTLCEDHKNDLDVMAADAPQEETKDDLPIP